MERIKFLTGGGHLEGALEACRLGNVDKVQRFVEKGWNPVTETDRNGCNALAWAAGEGHLSICQYLVEKCGVNINELSGKPKRKRHALHWAARNGRLDVVKWFISINGENI